MDDVESLPLMLSEARQKAAAMQEQKAELLVALRGLIGVIDAITERNSPHWVADMDTSLETAEFMIAARAAIAKATGGAQ